MFSIFHFDNLEISLSDAESSKSSTWTPSPRVADVGSRRKSRLAANFSGNEQ